MREVGLVQKLPPTHRIALLPVGDPKMVEKLAEEAISKNVTVAKLRERVAKLVRGDEPRGRPRVPPVVQTAKRLVAALTNEDTGHLAFQRADVDALEDAEREALKDALKRAAELVERLAKLVGK